MSAAVDAKNPFVPSLLYNDTEEELRSVVRRLLDDISPWSAVVSRLDRPAVHDARLWRALADVGVPALLVPESLGGAGASAREMAIVLEEVGRAAAPVPLLTSAVVA